MIKKIFLIITLLVFTSAPFAYGSLERATRIKVTKVIDHLNHFELKYRGENYIVHHKKGCGDVKEGDELTLVVRGELDDYQDELYVKNGRKCQIDQAVTFNKTLRVSGFGASKRPYSEVLDEEGLRYRIYFSEGCKAIGNMAGETVYLQQNGRYLSTGDKLYLPGNQGQCTLRYTEDITDRKLESNVPDPLEGVDIKLPSVPNNLRAVPSASTVYLFWDPASDDVAIDHYIVSASLYHIKDARARDVEESVQYMPNQITTVGNKPSLKLENLEPDELYFFRVIAVDTSGNISSYWSQEARTTTRSSILSYNAKPLKLRLELAQENDSYFLYKWDEPGSVRRRTVKLEVDGETVYSNRDWNFRQIRILKKLDRKNKELKLTVETFDFRGRRLDKMVKFSF